MNIPHPTPPAVLSHTDDLHCVCDGCRVARDARRRKARIADRRHTERHMIDPDFLANRR